MRRARRLGIDVSAAESLERRVERAIWAEKNGYQDCWIAEITDPDAFVTMGVIGHATSRIRLGTAIVPMGPRSVPSLAAATATVADASGGRFALGLGVSSEVVVQRWHGVVRGRPLRRTRETVELLRDLLAGGRSDHEGEYVRSKGFRLREAPAEPPSILLAAMNQRMLELAGEIADGVLLNFVPVSAIDVALDAVRRGAARAKRDALPEILLPVVADVTDDPDASVVRFAREIAFYLSAPPYQSALISYGFEDEVERGESAGRKATSTMLLPVSDPISFERLG
jgi:probable F420-dependent oxidoreductase